DAGLARQPFLGEEVDVAEVLALLGVEGRNVRLAGEDGDPAEPAGGPSYAGGGDGDTVATGDLEHRFAIRAREGDVKRFKGDGRHRRRAASGTDPHGFLPDPAHRSYRLSRGKRQSRPRPDAATRRPDQPPRWTKR